MLKKLASESYQTTRRRYASWVMVARDWLATIAPMRWSLTNNGRLVAETSAIVFLVVIVDKFFLGGSSGELNPNPFWIPVLLMSAQYGVIGGLVSTLATTAAFFVISMPPQFANQDFYSYAGALLAYPSGWLAYALVIGGIRSLHMLHAAELTRSLEDTRETMLDLSGGFERALSKVDRLERRIAGETSTVDAIIRALARLDSRDVQELTKSFAEVIRDGVGAGGLTLYLKTPRGITSFVRIEAGENCSLLGVPNVSDSLLDALGSGRGVVSRLDSDAPRLLPQGAVCAAPIKFEPSGDLYGVIIVERLAPYQELGQAARRAELLGLALGRMLRWMFTREISHRLSS